jgi:hypothetical protein
LFASSPSSYGCDPWSARLYISRGITKRGNTLMLTVVRNPDDEGNADDIMVAPGHDYQHLTVDVPLKTAIRDLTVTAVQ